MGTGLVKISGWIKLWTTRILITSFLLLSSYPTKAYDTVFDPTNLAEITLQGEEAAQNALELFETLTNMGEQLTKVKDVMSKVYQGTKLIVQGGESLNNIYNNAMYLAEESKRNIEMYKGLANAGWLTPMQLRDALAQTNLLAQQSMSMVANTINFCANIDSFEPADAISFLQDVDMRLAAIASMNRNLYNEIQRNVDRAQMNRIHREFERLLLTGKPTGKAETGPSNLASPAFFDSNGAYVSETIVPTGGNGTGQTDVVDLNDPTTIVTKEEGAAKEITAYIRGYSPIVYRVSMGLLFILGICFAAIGGYRKMKEGDTKPWLLDVGLGFILISILMSLLKLTANI